MKALHLAVGASSVGANRLVLDAFTGEQISESTVAGVAPGVVREDAFDRDPVAGLEREGSFCERDDRACALVGV
jgi:hypothetical protein